MEIIKMQLVFKNLYSYWINGLLSINILVFFNSENNH